LLPLFDVPPCLRKARFSVQTTKIRYQHLSNTPWSCFYLNSLFQSAVKNTIPQLRSYCLFDLRTTAKILMLWNTALELRRKRPAEVHSGPFFSVFVIRKNPPSFLKPRLLIHKL